MADENNIGGRVELDITDFRTNMAQLNREVRIIESGFRATAAGLGDWGSSIVGLEARIDSLNEIMSVQQRRIETLRAEHARVVSEQGENSRAAQNLQIQINRESEALARNERVLRDNTDRLNSFGRETEEADRNTSNFTGKLKSIASGAGKAAVATVAALGTAMVAAAAGAFKLAEKASDLSEAQNVVKETFKESNDAVLDWTKTVSDSAGISQSDATKFVGSMGAMLKSSGLSEKASGDMAKSLVQLTGDMSSFYNLEHAESWEKIRAGISGETEPLKQLGINMSVANLEAFGLSQGINKAYSEMSQAEQTTLRYNYLLSVTKDAQGDFARTLEGSFSNQLRVAKMNLESFATTVGQTFLPSFLGIIQAVNQGFKTGDWASVGNTIATKITDVLNLITNEFPAILTVANSIISGLATALVSTIPKLLPAVIETVLKLLDMLITLLTQNGPKLLQAGIDALTELIDGILSALPKLIPLAIALVLKLVEGIVNALPKLIPAAIDMVVAIVDGIIDALPKIIEAMPKLVKAVVDGIVQNLPKLIDAAVKLVIALNKAIIDNLPMIVSATIQIVATIAGALIANLPTILAQIPKIFTAIWDTFKKLNFISIGAAIIAGIKDGVVGAAKTLANSVADAAKGALNSAKKALGIHSPSKVFKEQVGQMIGLGMAEGILSSTKAVNNAMNGLNKKLIADGEVNLRSNINPVNNNSNQTTQGTSEIIVNNPLYLDGKLITTSTSRIQVQNNLSRARALGVVAT